MAQPAFEEIVDTFALFDDWEDRYRHVIELGKKFPSMPDDLRIPAFKVDGCTSQVWICPRVEHGRFSFVGDSDAMIVRGLVAILYALYDQLPLEDVVKTDAFAELGRLGLNDHLSAQRSNGVKSMIARVMAYVSSLDKSN